MPKSPYGKCSKCPLQDQPIIIGETNCEDDLSKVDVLIFAEAPANEEIKVGRPLVGKPGKIFRKGFSLSKLDQTNHFIGNVVMCSNTQDGKTVNPPDEAVECCKPNWEALLEMINPKLIVIMGTIPMKIFGIGDSGITKKRGNLFDYKGYQVLVTNHPSYILRNDGIESDEGQKYVDDLKKAYVIVTANINDIADMQFEDSAAKKKAIKDGKYTNLGVQDNPYTFKLPAWCYSEDICLVDIQHIRESRTILYVFRDKDGKKRFHKVDSNETYYYTGDSVVLSDVPTLENIKNVHLVKAHTKVDENHSLFESDLRTELKHSIDYRINRKVPELKYELKKMYADIEVYSAGKRNFPNPKKAPSPINAISWKINDAPTEVWIAKLPTIDKKEPEIPDDTIVKFFANERALLEAWFKMVRKESPDILTGWNWMGFDMLTFYNRSRKIGADINLMSPINITSFANNRYGECHVYGIYVMCMLDLFKSSIFNVEETYKLDAIAKKTLGEDFGKVAYVGSLDSLYEEDLTTFIKYSGTDTDILRAMDLKLRHIDLRYELMKICSSTWKAAETTMGQIDPLIISYAKNMNMVCRNALPKLDDGLTIPGAYVRDPLPGQHGYVVDLDFASLYPSIICSMNIGPNTYIAKVSPKLAKMLIYDKDKLFKMGDKQVDIIINPVKSGGKCGKIYINKLLEKIKKNKWIVTISGCIYKNQTEEVSFFNRVLTYLLDSRSEYKGQMKEANKENREDDFKLFNCRQLSYKILANSLYGVLANANFRMFNLDLAKTITLTGQEAIKFAGYHCGQYMKEGKKDINSDFMNNFNEEKIPYLIYVDTDSLFLALGDWLIDKDIISATIT